MLQDDENNATDDSSENFCIIANCSCEFGNDCVCIDWTRMNYLDIEFTYWHLRLHHACYSKTHRPYAEAKSKSEFAQNILWAAKNRKDVKAILTPFSVLTSLSSEEIIHADKLYERCLEFTRKGETAPSSLNQTSISNLKSAASLAKHFESLQKKHEEDIEKQCERSCETGQPPHARIKKFKESMTVSTKTIRMWRLRGAIKRIIDVLSTPSIMGLLFEAEEKINELTPSQQEERKRLEETRHNLHLAYRTEFRRVNSK